MPNIIRGKVAIESANTSYESVVAGTTGQVLGPTGGTLDYLDSVVVMANATGSCAVYLGDGGGGTVQIFGTVATATTHQVKLGLISQHGAFSLTTSANAPCLAIGRFK